jgi:ubiquinone biosynthesis protein Coq4
MRHGAIKEGEIRVEAWVFGRTVFGNVVALIGGLVDKTTLRRESETSVVGLK